MKKEIQIEEMENGWLLSIDGKQYVCGTRSQLVSIMMQNFGLYNRVEGMKKFWEGRIGQGQIKVIDLLRNRGALTQGDISSHLGKKFPQEIRTTLASLVAKGLLKRDEASKRYYLADPEVRFRPEGELEDETNVT